MRLVLALLVALALGAPATALARERMSVQDQYELGLKYLRRGYYIKALEQFNRIRNYHRDDPLSVKAELAIADVYYKKSEWDQARLAYEDFMRMHPRHPDLDYVVYRIGMTLYKRAPQVAARDQTYTRQAVNTWSGFDARFPDSDHTVEVATLLGRSRELLARKELVIAEFYERREAWEAVRGRAEGLLRSFPDSAWRDEALALLAVAAQAAGRTEQAEVALEKLLEESPAQADAVRRRMARVSDGEG